MRAEMDFLISRLEELQRPPMPSTTSVDCYDPVDITPVLREHNVGFWKLLYASNGTANSSNLLATLLHFVCSIPGVDVGRVMQDVQPDTADTSALQIENSVRVSMGALRFRCHALLDHHQPWGQAQCHDRWGTLTRWTSTRRPFWGVEVARQGPHAGGGSWQARRVRLP